MLLLLFVLLPVAAVIFLGFTDFELGYGKFRFVGFENYAHLLNDRTFRRSLWNTSVYTAIVAPVSIVLGLGVALLIEGEGRARGFFRTVYFLPVASLIVAMATVWQYIFHPTIGPLNALLALAGIPGPNWLGASNTVLYSLSIIGIWQSVGFNMVLFLAGPDGDPARTLCRRRGRRREIGAATGSAWSPGRCSGRRRCSSSPSASSMR